jgi:uncharacterized protein
MYDTTMERPEYLLEIQRLLRNNRVVALLGARQVGKSTLAQHIAKASSKPTQFYDLENPEDVAQLQDPMLALKSARGLVILDEIQRRPDLFPVLRVLADRPEPAKFLLLGSASIDLLQQSSESLAGRIAYLQVHPFSTPEVINNPKDRLWVRGGFPRSFLAGSEQASVEWRRNFIQTYVERDIPMLHAPFTPSASALGRFWSMLAHVHGQVLNWSELGRAMQVTDVTARRYTDVLEAAMVIRQLKPWQQNISKRQVKSPRLYFIDSGLLHTQLRIHNRDELMTHPCVGASWEGYCLEQVMRSLAPDGRDAFFWSTHQGAQLDLLLLRGGRRIGFDFRRTSSPTVTQSMRVAQADLQLDHHYVVHAGDASFDMASGISAIAQCGLADVLRKLKRSPPEMEVVEAGHLAESTDDCNQ